MTITTPHDVSVPPGFRAQDWQGDDRRPFRVLLGEVRAIDGVDVCLQATAIQFADGTLDDGSVHEPPLVYLGDDALTARQARELAALLVEAADVIDGWVAQ